MSLPAGPFNPVGNATIPKQTLGPASIPWKADATTGFDLTFNFQREYSNQVFSPPSRLYIDNHLNPSPLNIFISGTNFTGSFPPLSVGVVPLFVRSLSEIEISTVGGLTTGQAVTPVFMEFLNYDVECFVTSAYAPFASGATLVVEGRDGVNAMSDTNPLVTVPGSSNPVNKNLNYAGAGAADVVAASATPVGIRFRNIGDGAGNFPDAWYHVGAVANGTFANGDKYLPGDGQWVVLPYRTAQRLSVYASAATRIEAETY